MRKSAAELNAIRASLERVARLSDNLFQFGPFGIGIDGILSWIPGVGEVYSSLAGAFIVLQGLRAGVSPVVLALASALLVFRTVVTGVPVAGAAIADVFVAHRWAARLIIHAIDQKIAALSGDEAPEPRWSSRATTWPRGSTFGSAHA